jgi:uncharacterized protein YjiS (DUF1127 family)
MSIITLRRPFGAITGLRGRGEKSAVGPISRCHRMIARWLARRRTRIALCDIAADDHLLKDIGVSRGDALGEADKPFWRP